MDYHGSRGVGPSRTHADLFQQTRMDALRRQNPVEPSPTTGWSFWGNAKQPASTEYNRGSTVNHPDLRAEPKRWFLKEERPAQPIVGAVSQGWTVWSFMRLVGVCMAVILLITIAEKGRNVQRFSTGEAHQKSEARDTDHYYVSSDLEFVDIYEEEFSRTHVQACGEAIATFAGVSPSYVAVNFLSSDETNAGEPSVKVHVEVEFTGKARMSPEKFAAHLEELQGRLVKATMFTDPRLWGRVQKVVAHNVHSGPRDRLLGNAILEHAQKGLTMPETTEVTLVHWASKLSGQVTVMSVASDTEDYAYSTGVFSGIVTMGSYTHTASSFLDVFLMKATSTGTVQWVNTFGGSSAAVHVSDQNEVFLSGDFTGTSTFGSTILSSANTQTAFVTKVNQQGTVMWAVSLGEASAGYASSSGVAVEAFTIPGAGTSSVLVAGKFSNGASGSSSFGDNSFGATGTNSAFTYVATLSALSGEVEWVKAFGTASSGCTPHAIAVHPSTGTLFIGGHFYGTTAFGDIELTANTTTDSVTYAKIGSTFLLKMNLTSGEPSTVLKRYDNVHSADKIERIVTDHEGAAVICGTWLGNSKTFGALEVTSDAAPGATKSYVLKVSADGREMWALQASGVSGSSYTWSVRGLVSTGAGDVVMTGGLGTPLESDFREPIGSLDTWQLYRGGLFIAKVGALGTVHWAHSFGMASQQSSMLNPTSTSVASMGADVAVLSSGHAFVGCQLNPSESGLYGLNLDSPLPVVAPTTAAPTATPYIAKVAFAATVSVDYQTAITSDFQTAYINSVAADASVESDRVSITSITQVLARRRALLQTGNLGSSVNIDTEVMFDTTTSTTAADSFASSATAISVSYNGQTFTGDTGAKTSVSAPPPPPSPPLPPPPPIVAQNLWQAAKSGNLREVKIYVESGADISDRSEKNDAFDNVGSTPLIEAVWAGHYDIVDYLLAQGAHVHKKDKRKFAPIHHAARQGHEDIAKLLLKHGARVDARNKKNETPLHLATNYQVDKLVKLLLDQGEVSVNAKNYDGRTALDLCKKTVTGKQIKKMLIEQGAKRGSDIP
ncbi:hypothetical protein CYMTET_55772 [Cymbomonas tetramitiformis]|uniref:Uncharacterized protein n=1 Tax=Cymbomonas tetramitiformis TaxID=36881 RepID=A0AAE0BDG3_9CHLO|nr:hypothetical protein CYMTET_55772 [Cymbomonas tetramitiformis]